MDEKLRRFLLYICLIIICIVIIRCLYMFLVDTHIESFDGNNVNTDAVDLLSKYKSSSAQQVIGSNETNLEMKIHAWTTKNYNRNSALQQIKAIGLYKPILFINGVQYCKLGDILSQNIDYSLPNAKEFSLLIKQTGSDIKPPTDYELVIDIKLDGFKTEYYNYENYLNDNVSISNITDNFNNCINSYSNLNKIVKDNIDSIKTGFLTYIDNNALIIIEEEQTTGKPINKHTYRSNNRFYELVGKEISYNPENTILTVPVGINLSFHYLSTYRNWDTYHTINLPSTVDTPQDNIPVTLSTIESNVSGLPNDASYYKHTSIILQPFTKTIFSLIPLSIVINYISNICILIKNIYEALNMNPLYNDFKLYKDYANVTEVLTIVNKYIDYADDVDNNSFTNLIKDLDLYCVKTSLLGNILYIIKNSAITYNMPMFTYKLGTMIDKGYQNANTSNTMSIKSYNNDIISKIPNSMYNILSRNLYDSTMLNTLKKKVTEFLAFANDIESKTKTKKLFPLQIYKPIPPTGYSVLGYVFCNISSDLDSIKKSNSIACIPKQCVKIMRPWLATDKVFEFNKDSVYLAIYLNPYTGTFVCTNTNAQQLPEGNVSKVVACVAKCTAVDELEKAEDCARKYYNLNKQNENDAIKASNTTLVSDQEEVFYLDKLKAQSDSIAKLKKRAQQMQIAGDKATIVNAEMNKHKLQNYVDTQKQNIDIIMKRLQADKNKINANIIIPPDAKLSIINTIKNSTDLPVSQKNNMIAKLIASSNNNNDNNNLGISEDSLREILNSCPQYDLSNLVKKTTVADVCYGCDIPN